MKYRLPILILFGLALVALFARNPKVRMLLSLAAPQRQPEQEPLAIEPGNGQVLVQAAASRLAEFTSLQAKLRLETHMFGHRLSAVGTYFQSTRNDVPVFRLELKSQVGDRLASFQQVCDGRYVWQRSDLFETATLSRIDLRRVQEAMERAQIDPSSNPQVWLATGGLPKLLQATADGFDLGTAQRQQLGTLPVWHIQGTWKVDQKQRLHELSKGHPFDPEKPGQLAPFLPERVSIALGRDELLPMFPYRIVFARSDASQRWGRGEEGVEPLVGIEFFEVDASRALDPNLFRYDPANQDVEDATPEFLKRLVPASSQ